MDTYSIAAYFIIAGTLTTFVVAAWKYQWIGQVAVISVTVAVWAGLIGWAVYQVTH